jgi:DNA-binding response OmpR family regulator
MIRFALNVQGLDVVEAEDGFDALDKLSEQKVDLLIADWQMAKMDGLELLRQLRKMDEYEDLPVIMVSAKDDPLARREALDLGALTWVRKPFRIAEIQTIVEAGLGSLA